MTRKPKIEITREEGVTVVEESFLPEDDGTELDQAIQDAAAENDDGVEGEVITEDPPRQEEEYVSLTCKVEFTEQELADMSCEMARKIGELHDKEDAQKAVAAQMKAEIKALSGDVEQLAVKVRNKFEYRPVRCLVIRNYTAKEITYIRTDTGETHQSRTMRADEAQIEIPV